MFKVVKINPSSDQVSEWNIKNENDLLVMFLWKQQNN